MNCEREEVTLTVFAEEERVSTVTTALYNCARTLYYATCIAKVEKSY